MTNSIIFEFLVPLSFGEGLGVRPSPAVMSLKETSFLDSFTMRT
jgi:hypothetical protein